ncbi:mRNA splicing protein prp28 [Didymella heteroderae]|uniref:RNA helicase n=1 Tax=Didymella heteroderae TaxID=1769908 RepID=A0A9P4WHJ6_9PLEO|nr:mRNA splicing protein prp28 [Didymella heteroderae]
MDLPPPPPPPLDDAPPPPPPPSADAPPPPPPEEESLGPALLPKKAKKGWASQKKQPPSIDDILKAKREKEAAAAKPKFLSKAERERIALEKRQKEVEEARKRREGVGSASEANGHGANGVRNGSQNGAGSIPTGPRSMRQDAPNNGSSRDARESTRRDMAPPPVPDKKAGKRPPPEDAEAAMIRNRYMGAEQNQSTFSAKKKRKRTTEKKFNFEWNEEEDTSYDYNPIYQQRAEANFFGRGKLGGFTDDTTERSTQQFIEAMIERDPESGRARAEAILDMERRRKEEGSRAQLDKHWSEKKLEHMRERDWRIFKEDFNIATKGGAIPNPMRNWHEAGLPDSLMRIVDQVGYTEPSAIQRAAIPIALQCRDLIGVAVTGSGKTAAFILPLLVYISQLPPLGPMNRNDGPYALVLAPTRELAQQIEVEAKKFANPLGFRTAVIVGGHSIEEQAFQMRDGVEIIIATPGRLVDCIERRVLVLSQCAYVIMDEADRMIDMGFEEPVNKILDALPVGNEKPDDDRAEDPNAMKRGMYRQTMMYTATMPTAVERIARKYLRRPAIVTIGNAGEAVETVEQRVEFIPGEEKRKKRLSEILNSGEFAAPIIVFVNIKRNCDAIARDIKHMGFSAVTLHGSKTQEQREAALQSLRDGRTDVLVATDLAGRGIDVPDVSLVVNFNMATSIESYTHRIGRTGRAGKSGVAITFLGNEDADVLYDLKQMLSKSQISKVPEELRKHEAAQQKGGRKKEAKSVLT